MKILSLFFCLIVSFASSNLNCCEGNLNIESQTFLRKSTKGKNYLPNFDIETYDIYGNHQYYRYDDFDYSLFSNRGSYRPVSPHIISSDYSKYYSLPYSAVCTFYTSYDTNNDGEADVTYIGTGVLVGPDEVLTAEENTYSNDYGYAIDMYVALGEHREGTTLVRPFGVQHWRAISRGNYHSTFNPNDNWALVRIESRIGYQSGWLGVSETGISNGTIVKALGYNNYSYCEQIIYQGTVSSLSTYKFNHSASLNPMANGCPILDASLETIYGIQCGRRIIIDGVTYSQACKVSVYIEGWIQEDCGPLKITIFANPSSGSSGTRESGHSWITIKNNSPYNIVVGKMIVSPNTGVSIGTWGILSHLGLYYNMEHLYNTEPNGRVSFSRNIFASQFNNDVILDNDYWGPIRNCAFFATEVWNANVPSNYAIDLGSSVPLPRNVCALITNFTGYIMDEYVIGTDNVGYYSGDTFIHYED